MEPLELEIYSNSLNMILGLKSNFINYQSFISLTFISLAIVALTDHREIMVSLISIEL